MPSTMTFSRLAGGSLAAAFLLCLPASAATIKVKSGAVHEGTIQGQIVLKGSEREATSEADPSKTVYYASYTVVNGADLAAIDEKGVRSGTPAGVFDVTQEGDTIDDADVVRSGLKIPASAAFGSTKKAGTIARASRPTPARDAVLGEFRDNELRPEIEITTAKGVVKVPVEDLVPLAAE